MCFSWMTADGDLTNREGSVVYHEMAFKSVSKLTNKHNSPCESILRLSEKVHCEIVMFRSRNETYTLLRLPLAQGS